MQCLQQRFVVIYILNEECTLVVHHPLLHLAAQSPDVFVDQTLSAPVLFCQGVMFVSVPARNDI